MYELLTEDERLRNYREEKYLGEADLKDPHFRQLLSEIANQPMQGLSMPLNKSDGTGKNAQPFSLSRWLRGLAFRR